MTKEELKSAMLKKASDGKMSCAVAQALARELGVTYKEVGAVANELGIKIKDCQLGCF